MTSESVDFDQLLEEQTGNRTTVPICMKRHLRDEYERVAAELATMRGNASGPQRLASSDSEDAKAKAAELAEIEKAKDAATVNFVVDEIDRRDWNKMVMSHPPRKGEDGDKALGVNLTAFMEEAIPACVSDPDLTPERWAKLRLSSHDYDRLLNAVWEMNRGGADLPKLPPALREIMTGSDA